MKQVIVLMAGFWVGIGVSPLHASKFNLDGLKELQDRGKEIAEQAENLSRMAVLGDERCDNIVKDNGAIDGRCLEVAGSLTKDNQGVVIKDCKDDMSQRWRFDEQNRLINAGGICLGYRGDPGKPGTGVKTENCQGGQRQVWRKSENRQLVNSAGLCLDGSGNAPVLRKCDDKQLKQKWGMFD